MSLNMQAVIIYIHNYTECGVFIYFPELTHPLLNSH